MTARNVIVTCVAALVVAVAVWAGEPVRNLQDLIGIEKGDGGYQMQQRGYTYVRSERAGSNEWTYWRESRSNRCVMVKESDNRYRIIEYVMDFDCQGQGGGDSWDGGHSGGDSWDGSGQGSGGTHERGVTLFRDLNFTGVSETYTNDVPDMRRTRFGDDHATSVSIGRGCTARLYRDLNFQGAYTEVTSDIGDLRGSRVGDDQVTSLQVRCSGRSDWGGGDDRWGSESHGGGGYSNGEDRFDTVCGVIVNGETHRYRCTAVDFFENGRVVKTALHYPDMNLRAVWRSGNEVELHFEGMTPQWARYSRSGDETDIYYENKTYFYISDKNAARREVANFWE